MHFAHVKKGEYAMSTKRDIKKLARELISLADDNEISSSEIEEDEDVVEDRETANLSYASCVGDAFFHITGSHLGETFAETY